jgi:cell division protein YceG involved in septum cleavage
MLVSAEIRRPGGSDDTPLEFVVSQGEATYSIAARLAEQKIIRQPLLFVGLARMQQLDSKLQAGNFLLRQNMTMNEVMVALLSNSDSSIISNRHINDHNYNSYNSSTNSLQYPLQYQSQRLPMTSEAEVKSLILADLGISNKHK